MAVEFILTDGVLEITETVVKEACCPFKLWNELLSKETLLAASVISEQALLDDVRSQKQALIDAGFTPPEA